MRLSFSNFPSVHFSSMSKWISNGLASALIATLLTLSPMLAAQTSADLQVGYVNPGRVSDEAPQADAARRQLQEELRALEDRLAEERLALSPEAQQDLQRDIVNRRRRIQRQQEAFREDFNMRRNEALGDLQQRILRVVSDFAEEQGFDLVVSDGVVYASETINITDRIIERLRLQYEQQNGNE